MSEVLTPFGKRSSDDVIAVPKGMSFNMTAKRPELRFLFQADNFSIMKAELSSLMGLASPFIVGSPIINRLAPRLSPIQRNGPRAPPGRTPATSLSSLSPRIGGSLPIQPLTATKPSSFTARPSRRIIVAHCCPYFNMVPRPLEVATIGLSRRGTSPRLTSTTPA